MNDPLFPALPIPKVSVPCPDPNGNDAGGAGRAKHVSPAEARDELPELDEPVDDGIALARLEMPGALGAPGKDGEPDGGITQIVRPLLVLRVMLSPTRWPFTLAPGATVILPDPPLGTGSDGAAGLEKHSGALALADPAGAGTGRLAEVRLAAPGTTAPIRAAAPSAPAPSTAAPATPTPSFHDLNDIIGSFALFSSVLRDVQSLCCSDAPTRRLPVGPGGPIRAAARSPSLPHHRDVHVTDHQ